MNDFIIIFCIMFEIFFVRPEILGSSIKHVDRFSDFLARLPPLLLYELNKTCVIKWSIGYLGINPPPPSTVHLVIV